MPSSTIAVSRSEDPRSSSALAPEVPLSLSGYFNGRADFVRERMPKELRPERWMVAPSDGIWCALRAAPESYIHRSTERVLIATNAIVGFALTASGEFKAAELHPKWTEHLRREISSEAAVCDVAFGKYFFGTAGVNNIDRESGQRIISSNDLWVLQQGETLEAFVRPLSVPQAFSRHCQKHLQGILPILKTIQDMPEALKKSTVASWLIEKSVLAA